MCSATITYRNIQSSLSTSNKFGMCEDNHSFYHHLKTPFTFPPSLAFIVTVSGTPDGAVLVEGGLSRAVKPDESTWTIEGKHKDVVHVYMEKADSDLMWSSVIEGHVDADAG